MGNLTSIKDNAAAEFERVRQEVRSGAKPRTYLVIDQLLRMQIDTIVRDFPVDLTHLGMLYMLDRKKKGKFYLEDIMSFIDLCYAREGNNKETHELQQMTKFQAFCTLHMWHSVTSPGGHERFVVWFCRLFSEIMRTRTFPAYANVKFMREETIKTLHRILNIQTAYGIDGHEFFELLRGTAEEMELPIVRDKSLRDWVPVEIVRIFAEKFLRGFENMMKQIGFEPTSK